jgi:putative acetyltransferase
VSEERVAIRAEEPRDHARVHEIVAAAFGREDEARLVDALRGRVAPELSLVAEGADGTLLGHVYFSPVRVGRSAKPAMALGPVAVDPGCQNRAVGSRLCRRGLEACRAIGEHVVFVLGHPTYYPRFGFRPARPHGLYYKNEHFDAAFFVTELSPGALAGFEGEVCYRPEFDGV